MTDLSIRYRRAGAGGWLLLPCVLIATGLLSCGKKSPTQPEPPGGRDLAWREVKTTSTELNAVWGSSPHDVFAVGNEGRAAHFDGTTWTEQFVGTGSDLEDVWGSSAADVYAVAELYRVPHFDGVRWVCDESELTYQYAIWGTSASNVYVAGTQGVGRFDGSTWTVDRSMGLVSLRAIWGVSANDLFAVGGDRLPGVILHYDGTAWTSMTTNCGCFSLTAVWGTSPSNVYAVGGSKILRYDGSVWSVVWEGAELRSIWGSSASDIYAVGNDGLILHYDGSNWKTVDIGTTEDLRDIWGSSALDIYIVGVSSSPEPSIDGVIFHYGSQ